MDSRFSGNSAGSITKLRFVTMAKLVLTKSPWWLCMANYKKFYSRLRAWHHGAIGSTDEAPWWRRMESYVTLKEKAGLNRKGRLLEKMKLHMTPVRRYRGTPRMIYLGTDGYTTRIEYHVPGEDEPEILYTPDYDYNTYQQCPALWTANEEGRVRTAALVQLRRWQNY